MKPDPWTHFHDAFRSMDRAFRDIDTSAVRHTKTESRADPLGRQVHELTARTWRSRWRMFRLFAWLAWRIITRGRVTVRL
jgi:hypothetical protein